MWIFSRRGFYSVVEAADPGSIQIRARDREHLESLQLGAEIVHLAGADYPYRVIVPKGVAVDVISALAQEIDYRNFKDTLDREHGRRSWFAASCHEIWGVLWDRAFDLRTPDVPYERKP